MFWIFDILFSIVPIFIIIFVIIAVIKGAYSNNKTKQKDNLEDAYKTIDQGKKQLDHDVTDKEIEEELVRRFNESDNKGVTNTEAKHDNTCNEHACDGCGSGDVYDQVYGKRKRNKLKKK